MTTRRSSHHQMLPSSDDGAETPTFLGLETDHHGTNYLHNNHLDSRNTTTTTIKTTRCGLRLDTVVSRALAWDMMARSMIGMSSVYLGPALLDLAGDQTVLGTSPGSLLTNLAAVSGFLGCLALPLAGSVLDHTAYRKSVGSYSALGLVTLKGLEIPLLQPSGWLWLLPMQVILAVIFNIHLMAVYAYVSELSSDPTVQAAYNSAFGIVLYLASLTLLVGVLIGSAFLSTDDSGTAQIALAITTIACTLGFGLSWTTRGLPERPALHVIASDESIWTAGFVKLASTIRTLFQNRAATAPAMYVLCAVAFGEAARAALISVSTTYMKLTLKMNADEIGLVFLAVLLAGIPGNKLGEYISAKSQNPVLSVSLCNGWFVLSTIGAAFVLHGPDQKHYAPIFGGLWGVSIGWITPAHTSAFVPLIPSGCNAEWMGFFILATASLSWLPPAVFSLLNELGWSMDVGLMSLNVFFFAAIICLRQVGNFSDAVELVKEANTKIEMHELT